MTPLSPFHYLLSYGSSVSSEFIVTSKSLVAWERACWKTCSCAAESHVLQMTTSELYSVGLPSV